MHPSRVGPQRDCDVPVTYGVFDDFGDLSKDAIFKSKCSCRSGYIWCGVSMACVCGVGVCSYMNRFYSCTQMRGVRKNK
jgi:hypothetical protein